MTKSERERVELYGKKLLEAGYKINTNGGMLRVYTPSREYLGFVDISSYSHSVDRCQYLKSQRAEIAAIIHGAPAAQPTLAADKTVAPVVESKESKMPKKTTATVAAPTVAVAKKAVAAKTPAPATEAPVKSAAKKAVKAETAKPEAAAKAPGRQFGAKKEGLRSSQERVLKALVTKDNQTRAQLAESASVDITSLTEVLGSHDSAKRIANDTKHYTSLITLGLIAGTATTVETKEIITYKITTEGKAKAKTLAK